MQVGRSIHPRGRAVVRGPVVVALACVAAFGSVARAQWDALDAPTTYYQSVNTAAPAGVFAQLRTVISTGLTPRNYLAATTSALYTDADPNVPGNILLMYDRTSVSATWDSGVTWNREHIWPQSRLGASASNGTTNIASDQFNLRPCDPDVNNSHANLSFGAATTTGTARPVSGLWYPGDIDLGDAARSVFYMATRHSQLTLVNGVGVEANEQYGDKASLLRYHYRDVPDTFERRRNHAIYGLAGATGTAITNPHRQQNRNPYVDRPEWAHAALLGNDNDTRLRVGAAAANADGSSSATVNLGRVLANAPVPAAQTVTINKEGLHGTYYSVTPTGLATSSVVGRFNAFAMDATGSRTISVGLATSTATPGLKTGTVTLDNLDITTAGGAGRGANDADDVVTVSLSVLAASNPSFAAASDVNVLSIDFGTVLPGARVPFSIANLASGLGSLLTARLDLDSITAAGDTSAFSTTLAAFTNLDAGAASSFLASVSTAAPAGTFAATYTLNLSDENLPGTVATSQLTLNLSATVLTSLVPEPAAAGLLCPLAWMLTRRARR